jgi:hypothetical protein
MPYRVVLPLAVLEHADWSTYDSVDITFRQMMFGAEPADVTAGARILRDDGRHTVRLESGRGPLNQRL